MSVFVHYDRAGVIHSFVTVNATDGSSMMLTPKPGHLVAEVEGLQPQAGPALRRQLREIAKSQVVASHQRVTLAKKP